jgi:hypothetical protein
MLRRLTSSQRLAPKRTDRYEVVRGSGLARRQSVTAGALVGLI